MFATVTGSRGRRGCAALAESAALILRMRGRLSQGLEVAEQVREFLDRSQTSVELEELFRDPLSSEARTATQPVKLALLCVLFVLNASGATAERARVVRAVDALIELYRGSLALLANRCDDADVRSRAESALAGFPPSTVSVPARAVVREARARLVDATFAVYGSHGLCARLEALAQQTEELRLAESHNRCFSLFETVLNESETSDPVEDQDQDSGEDPAFVVQPLRPTKLLPTKKPTAPMLTLVLDLDETLVHFEETSAGGEFLVRPGATDFLEAMAKSFEVVIFTAAVKDYADWILDRLDPSKQVAHRLYRQHTQPLGGVYLKDLSRLGRELSQTIIVDNNAENFALQPDNGILIKTWHDDPRDSALAQLASLLSKIALSKPKDVRHALEQVQNTYPSKKTNVL